MISFDLEIITWSLNEIMLGYHKDFFIAFISLKGFVVFIFTIRVFICPCEFSYTCLEFSQTSQNCSFFQVLSSSLFSVSLSASLTPLSSLWLFALESVLKAPQK